MCHDRLGTGVSTKEENLCTNIPLYYDCESWLPHVHIDAISILTFDSCLSAPLMLYEQ